MCSGNKDLQIETDMRVLHITNSYGGTAVYTNLYTAIDQNSDTEQWVYVPLNSRNHSRVGNMMIDFRNKGSQIHYDSNGGIILWIDDDGLRIRGYIPNPHVADPVREGRAAA